MEVSLKSMFSFVYPIKSYFKNFSFNANEIVYSITGKGTTEINDQKYDYHENTVTFTKKNDVKSNYANEETKYLCIRFTGNINIENLKSGVFFDNDKSIYRLFIEIQEEIEQKKTNYKNICNAKIYEILILITRTNILTSKDRFFYELIKEIDSTFIYNKSIKQLAENSNYSYDYFRHKFKKIFGIAPNDYIINKRIENSAKLLLTHEYSCTQIAEMCGFSTPAQFSLIFRKKMGFSPNEYQSAQSQKEFKYLQK